MEQALSICSVCNGWSGNPCEFCGHHRDKRYSVVLADPPWPGENTGNRAAPSYEGEQREDAAYKTMTLADICAMGPWLESLLTEDAFLFLWAPNIMVLGGEAAQVAKAWGFMPKAKATWLKLNKSGDKLAMGMGNYWRNCTEDLILCRRGRATVARHDMLNVIFGPRRAHSQKPVGSYFAIEALTGAGYFLELFSRYRHSERWICHGNQAPRTGYEK